MRWSGQSKTENSGREKVSGAAGRRKKSGSWIKFMSSVLLCLAVGFIGTGAVIWARPTAVVTNTLDTGIVEIELQEYRLDEDGREVKWEDNLTILPRMSISKIPRISNQGNACYIRARTIFSGTEQLDETCLYGISKDWIRAEDGYYYCRSILADGAAVDFFEGLQIPEDFGQEQEEQKITLTIQVDAIQSRNVTPDFQAESPWGAVEILETEKTAGREVRVLRTVSEKKFVVEYQGESAEVIINEENFFGNLPTLLPGDEYTDGAKLVNSGKRPVQLYFRSIVEDATDITDRIKLTIETETEGQSKVIYEGPIRAENLTEDTLLMTIPAQSQGKMVFSLHVPAELDNEYTLQDKAVQWIFSTEEIMLPNEAVNTGDNRTVGGYFALAGLSLGFAVRMIQRKRRENERKA